MPVVTRSTVTTTNRSGTTQHTIIPLWTIKLVTAILCVVVLVLVFLQSSYMWQAYTRTFIAIILASGYLLGWALPSVLNRFLPFHKVDISLHGFSTVLAVIALVLSVIFLIDRNDYSRSEDYKLMIGVTVCLGFQVVLLFILVSWLCYGNYTVIDS